MNLSIIVPVYDTEKYLHKCFESLIPIIEHVGGEVIFVNDGSPDNGHLVLEEFKRKYNFVKVIAQENQGLSAARNAGIEVAQGTYFILLDSDDWLNPEAIIQVFNTACSLKPELVSFRLQYVDENLRFQKIDYEYPLPYYELMSGQSALINGYHPASACLFMYQTEFVKKSNLRFYLGIMQEDIEFTIRLLIKAQSVYFTKIIGYNYYRRADSMTTTLLKELKERYLADGIRVAELVRNNIAESECTTSELKKAIEKNYNSIVWSLLWSFCKNFKEVDYDFKVKCLQTLKAKNLYPIKGELKTKFQHVTRYLFNVELLVRFVYKIRN